MTDSDQRQLRRLAHAHYLVAAITALLALVGIPAATTGWGLMWAEGEALPEVVEAALAALEPIYGPMDDLRDPELRWLLGVAMLAAGLTIVVASLVHGAVIALIGRLIARRRRRWLCVAFSVLDLMYVLPPLGTALSVYALIVLRRPGVKQQFRPRAARTATGDTADDRPAVCG
jgi:hypothetical protein